MMYGGENNDYMLRWHTCLAVTNELRAPVSAVAADVTVPRIRPALNGRKLFVKASEMSPGRHVLHSCTNLEAKFKP